LLGIRHISPQRTRILPYRQSASHICSVGRHDPHPNPPPLAGEGISLPHRQPSLLL
jgi:hypothetical protein